MTTRSTGKRVTETNPVGVRAFDHTRFAHLPEYDAATKALNALVQALERADIPVAQAAWLEAVTDMAAALPYGDLCHTCDRRDQTTIPTPVKADIDDGGWLTGTYRCPTCNTRWTCGWAANFPAYI